MSSPVAHISDAALEAEIAALEARRSRLQRLITLRQELSTLESHQAPAVELSVVWSIILKTISRRTAITPEEICSSRRWAELVDARFIAFYLARLLTSAALARIGRMARRDHTSVIYACASVRDRLTIDPAFAREVAEIRADCEQELKQLGSQAAHP